MDTKAWYLSRGVWGSVVVIGAMLLKQFGHDISPELQGQMVDFAINAVTLVGGAVALWGRIKATKTIGTNKPTQ
jgi:hypothetical protein